jgi:hypothetical protein
MKNGCTHFASNDISITESTYFHQNTTQIAWQQANQVYWTKEWTIASETESFYQIEESLKTYNH